MHDDWPKLGTNDKAMRHYGRTPAQADLNKRRDKIGGVAAAVVSVAFVAALLHSPLWWIVGAILGAFGLLGFAWFRDPV